MHWSKVRQDTTEPEYHISLFNQFAATTEVEWVTPLHSSPLFSGVCLIWDLSYSFQLPCKCKFGYKLLSQTLEAYYCMWERASRNSLLKVHISTHHLSAVWFWRICTKTSFELSFVVSYNVKMHSRWEGWSNVMASWIVIYLSKIL